MLQDDQLESCAIWGCMSCTEEEENGTVLLWWSASGMPLCLLREKKKKHKNFIILLYCKGRVYIVKVKSQCPLREQYVGLLPFGLWTFFIKFESFLLVPHSPDSSEGMHALKRLMSNKPVSEKWVFKTN